MVSTIYLQRLDFHPQENRDARLTAVAYLVFEELSGELKAFTAPLNKLMTEDLPKIKGIKT